MTTRTRLLEAQQEALYHQYCANARHSAVLDLERLITIDSVAYLCAWECSVVWYSDGYPYAHIDCISEVQAFDAGGHQVIDPQLRAKIDAAVKEWADCRIEELEELAREKEDK